MPQPSATSKFLVGSALLACLGFVAVNFIDAPRNGEPRDEQIVETTSQKSPSTSPPLLDELKAKQGPLRFDKLIERSTVEAEAFRQSILISGNGQVPTAELIARACVDFKRLHQHAAGLELKAEPYDLSRFELSAQQIVDAIRGDREVPDSAQFYGSFEGKWFGIWDQKNVDHHWGPYVSIEKKTIEKELKFEVPQGLPVALKGYQYAWVGDGYGLNHVASSKEGLKNFLLGYVVHIRDKDLEQEVFRRPHVGVIDGTDRLIWITKSEVFFEEMIRGVGDVSDRYYITGFRYVISNSTAVSPDSPESLIQSLTATEAFQAVYTRDPNLRQPWRGFKIELILKAD